MKSDIQVQKDVMDQLRWEPLLQSSEIGVAVKNGVVTLSGQVDSYFKKLAAEKAAKGVKGVKIVAEDIVVGISSAYRKTDAEIAQAILNALEWHSAVQEEKIKIKVEDGIVRLEGEVDWDYQRNAAKSAIENLAGVKSVINQVLVKPKVIAKGIIKKITEAFHRSATIDAQAIEVGLTGNTITLSGKVRSSAEKMDAENAAWAAPGVVFVDNKLEIEIPAYALEV